VGCSPQLRRVRLVRCPRQRGGNASSGQGRGAPDAADERGVHGAMVELSERRSMMPCGVRGPRVQWHGGTEVQVRWHEWRSAGVLGWWAGMEWWGAGEAYCPELRAPGTPGRCSSRVTYCDH
jgi:hypothetical protein